jgi:integrase
MPLKTSWRPERVALLRRQPRLDDQPIFVNRYGEPLGANGVRFKLKAYIRMAERCAPSLAKKHVTPHTFRHSMGVAMGPPVWTSQ